MELMCFLRSRILKFIRWSSWSDTKIIFLLISLGILILEFNITNFWMQFVLVFSLVAFFCLYGILVSIANDYWDIKVDVEANKPRPISKISWRSTVIVFGGLLLLYLVLLSYISITVDNVGVFILGVFNIVVGFMYSAPPFRFKESGWIGVLVGSIIQRTLPLSLLFYIFDFINTSVISLVVLSVFLGVRLMLTHQVEDYETDRYSGVRTFVVVYGIFRAKKAILEVFYIELSLLFIFLINLKNPFLLVWILMFLYIPSFIFINVKNMKFVYDFSMNYFPLFDLYYIWLPFAVGLCVFVKTHTPILLILSIYLQKKHLFNYLKLISNNGKK